MALPPPHRRRRLTLGIIAGAILAAAAGTAAAVLADGSGGSTEASPPPPRSTHAMTSPGSASAQTTAPPATTATTPPPATTAKAHAIRPLAGYVIQIDPGHNINNWRYPAEINRPVAFGPPGQTKACDTTGAATASGYSEALYNLTVGTKVVGILRSWGATVVMTPVNRVPWGPCITERAAIGNRIHANAAVSIHADGSPSAYHGFYVIVPQYPLPNVGLTAAMIRSDDRLGAAMLTAYHRVTGMPVSNLYPTGYLRSEAYGGTDLSHVPKIFIETGNMPNPGEAARLESPAFRARVALGIADGIRLFLTGRY